MSHKTAFAQIKYIKGFVIRLSKRLLHKGYRVTVDKDGFHGTATSENKFTAMRNALRRYKKDRHNREEDCGRVIGIFDRIKDPGNPPPAIPKK